MKNVTLVNWKTYFMNYSEREFTEHMANAHHSVKYLMTEYRTFYPIWTARLLFLSSKDIITIGSEKKVLYLWQQLTHRTAVDNK